MSFVEDNRPRSSRRALIASRNSLLDQPSAEVRIDKPSLGSSYRFLAVCV
jgi:hypothetical protein